MQESREQQKMYGFLQKAVYMVVVIECAIVFFGNAQGSVLPKLLQAFAKMPVFFPPMNAKLAEIVMTVLIAIGTKPRKDQDINTARAIVMPVLLGLVLMFGSLLLIDRTFDPDAVQLMPYLNLWQAVYAAMSFVGVFALVTGSDNISKILKDRLGKDRWNVEEESFDQNRELVDTETSLNIPYLFYFGKRVHNGWINVNPFRGTLVIGTPGSGKSFGVINPAIRQFVRKGFAILLYDYKNPDLAKIAYYHYRLKKQNDKGYKHRFAVINVNDPRKSLRVNPIKKEYLPTLQDAVEMATSIFNSLNKGGSGSEGGSAQFFSDSAINFLSPCIAFLSKHANGRYASIPHLLAFLNRSYEEIFTVLFSDIELHSLLSTFRSSFEKKAFDQLEGQVGTLKVAISRLASKESFWVFSADEVNLKISDPDRPTILVLASDPSKQDINSSLYSAVINRSITLINSKGNLPSAVIADEFPTIYLHKVDNLMATARSNRVAVMLGFQELPQLRQFYKKDIGDTILSITGNLFSGSLRDKQSLDWSEKIYGKKIQVGKSMSVNNNQTTLSYQEKMESLIPAGKISALKQGEMVGIVALDDSATLSKYKTPVFKGKINLDMDEIAMEEQNYVPLPTYYDFSDENGNDRMNEVLMANFIRINREVETLVQGFMQGQNEAEK